MNQAVGELTGFIGVSTQYGHGLGGIFCNVFRMPVPLLKRGFSLAEPHLKTAATNIMGDVIFTIPRGAVSEKQERSNLMVIGWRLTKQSPDMGVTNPWTKQTLRGEDVPKRSQAPRLISCISNNGYRSSGVLQLAESTF